MGHQYSSVKNIHINKEVGPVCEFLHSYDKIGFVLLH
jgi:hypothetical protein